MDIQSLFEYLKSRGFGVLPLVSSGDKWVFLVNTTPHVIRVMDGNDVKYIIPEASDPLRLDEVTEPVEPVADIPRVRKKLGGLHELPPVQEGVFYIVPLAVAQAARRPDFLVPDDLVRDAKDRVIGCRRFAIVFEGCEGRAKSV